MCPGRHFSISRLFSEPSTKNVVSQKNSLKSVQLKIEKILTQIVRVIFINLFLLQNFKTAGVS